MQDNDIDLSPPYMVGSKEVVKDHDKPRWIKKKALPDVTKSWHNYMVKKVIQDFQATVLQVSETPYDEKIVSTIPAVQYEFPTGYHQVYVLYNVCVMSYKQNKIIERKLFQGLWK